MKVYTRKKITDTHYADPEPQPEIVCGNPKNNIEFAYNGANIEGFDCREITQDELDGWQVDIT